MTRTRNMSKQRKQPGINDNWVLRPLSQRKDMVITTVLSAYSTQVDISAPPVYGSFYLTAGLYGAATPLLSAFDQYRIIEASVTFIPQMVNSVITSGTVATLVPTSLYLHNVLCTNVDQDDATTPTSEANVLTHETARIHGPFVKPFSRTFKPMIASEVFQTGGFGGYAPLADQWLDCASPNIQHYGLKYSIAHGSTLAASEVEFAVYTSVKIQFRKVL